MVGRIRQRYRRRKIGPFTISYRGLGAGLKISINLPFNRKWEWKPFGDS